MKQGAPRTKKPSILRKGTLIAGLSAAIMAFTACGATESEPKQEAIAGSSVSNSPSSSGETIENSTTPDLSKVNVCGMVQHALDSRPEIAVNLDSGWGQSQEVHYLTSNGEQTEYEKSGEFETASCTVHVDSEETVRFNMEVSIFSDSRREPGWSDREFSEDVVASDRPVINEYPLAIVRLEPSIFLSVETNDWGSIGYSYIDSNYEWVALPLLDEIAAAWDNGGAAVDNADSQAITTKNDLCNLIDQDLVREVLFSTSEEELSLEFDPYEMNENFTAGCWYKDGDSMVGAKFVQILFVDYETEEAAQEYLQSLGDSAEGDATVTAGSWIVEVKPGATDSSEVADVKTAANNLALDISVALVESGVTGASLSTF